VTLSTGKLIIEPDKWIYNSSTKILKFNVTFASPILVDLLWTTTTTLPSAPAGGGGGGGGAAALPSYLRILIINPDTAIAQAANSSVTYPVSIQNTGTFSGNFSLTITGLPKNYYIVSPSISLTSKAKGILNYTLILPPDATSGMFTIIVNGVGGGHKTSKSFDVDLTVVPPVISNVTVPVPYNITVKPNVTGVIIPTGAIAKTIAQPTNIYIASAIISVLIIIGIIRFIAKRRKPWKTSFKPSYQEYLLLNLKRQIRKRFE
jgi:hypothetical protein